MWCKAETLRSILVLACICAASPRCAQSARASIEDASAVPLEPIGAIVEAFRSRPIVAISDAHGNAQAHAFRLALVRDPRIVGVVDDIVVEFGTARYQAVVDRFVDGRDVPYDELRKVWQDTTQIEEAWDLPIYEEFFRAVRAINASRTQPHRLRVLLGDPAVDWATIGTADDLRSLPDRDAHAVKVIRREVLARGRRALVIYGTQHLVRRSTLANTTDEPARSLVGLLEQNGQVKVFNVHTETRMDLAGIQPDVASWPRPTLARLAGTALGAHVADTAPGRRHVPQQDQFDAVLYLGPPATLTTSTLSSEQCQDEAYVRMRSARLKLLPAPPNAPFEPADRIKVTCAFIGQSDERADDDAKFTELVRSIVADVLVDRVEPARFAPELRSRLVLFFQTYAPRLLKPMGPVTSIRFIAEGTVLDKRYRKYRVAHEKGSATWIVGVASDGTIASMDPRRE